tara:strand:+ start:3119 stop:3979 length:861 start_codon:yes stop_codon:yes gene_type:complete
MSHSKVKLSQVLRDFKINIDDDDYVNDPSDVVLRNLALRGIREIGFDLGKKIRSLKLPVDSTNNTVALPDDFVDVVKLGIVDNDGVVRCFAQNRNMNFSRRLEVAADEADVEGATRTDEFAASPLNIPANEIVDRVDDKSSTSGADLADSDTYYEVIFENFLHEGTYGNLYGFGGGHTPGEYRINLDQNRIEIDTRSTYTELVIEYVADEARSGDPEVHVYAEEALRCYIYYRLVERKSSVPANEKARARAEFYNERRKANARLGGFSKEQALHTIRKNFKQAPKY